jgi:hypothetical protein
MTGLPRRLTILSKRCGVGICSAKPQLRLIGQKLYNDLDKQASPDTPEAEDTIANDNVDQCLNDNDEQGTLERCVSTTDPDAVGTANFSAWTNANLTSLTERIDNTQSAGNGGSIGVATGIKAIAGAYGNTTVTHVNSAVKGMMSIAIKP